ncbi:MAG: transglycosylase SLT domain-containing protein [Timaviella obliquedivisa GSE-PSE-MK23-08B]|jgi:soluble lytic murein transglycosylase|nr:transglycosylase SLT domain-containing protein [Timaviella obliquedivisa GSE-PSE-MK23-08B]
MLERKKKQAVVTGVSLTALTLGAAIFVLPTTGMLPKLPIVGQWFQTLPSSVVIEADPADRASKVLAAATLPIVQRSPILQAATQQGSGLDRQRAKYLLASDLIEQGKGGAALPLLERLENSYSVLAPYVLIRRAQAYTQMGETAKAEATWQALVKNYGDDPASVEGLFVLGKKNPQFWNQAIAQFPRHPRTVEIAQTRLKQNPKQPQLLLITAQALYAPDLVSALDRLKTEYAAQLKPEHWEAIGFGYWEKQEYAKAAEAYAKAPSTPLTLYRAGRGMQLEGKITASVLAYQRLLKAYPDADESGTALLKLAEMNALPENAVPYLDQAIKRFPNNAAEALAAKSNILQEINSPKSSIQARQSVLSQYSSSEAAAEIRWKQAEANAKKGDARAAWEWARQLAQENPSSKLAPKAAFWVGKWAAQVGRKEDAADSFRYVLANYPESYYAWRSAVYLGWDVGDFTTVRQKLPPITKPQVNATPPIGSAALRELYQLGQYRDAWTLWQTEFKNRQQPSVTEQFTDGLMRLGINDNLEGIFMISNLDEREKPADRQEHEQLQQQRSHWEALYPFPYEATIAQWSQQRQINPLLVTGLIRQESRFETKIRSVADAVGLMQIIPDTADFVAEQNGMKKFNLEDPNDNIKLGTWYLDYTHQEYDNNSLFAVASYNAGPGAVAGWIQEFGFTDPDKFVTQIPYPETQGYVEFVFENYWNYLRLYNPEVSEKLAQVSQKQAVLGKAQ